MPQTQKPNYIRQPLRSNTVEDHSTIQKEKAKSHLTSPITLKKNVNPTSVTVSTQNKHKNKTYVIFQVFTDNKDIIDLRSDRGCYVQDKETKKRILPAAARFSSASSY